MMKRQHPQGRHESPDSVVFRAIDIERPLTQAVQRILAVSQPNRIILFGSQARGDADGGSENSVTLIRYSGGFSPLFHLPKTRVVGVTPSESVLQRNVNCGGFEFGIW